MRHVKKLITGSNATVTLGKVSTGNDFEFDSRSLNWTKQFQWSVEKNTNFCGPKGEGHQRK